MGLSPGGVLNNQNPIPAQPAPLWWRVTKWAAPAAVSIAPAWWTYRIADAAVSYLTSNPNVQNLSDYLTFFGAEAAFTVLGYEFLDYCEGRHKAYLAERAEHERTEWFRRRQTDQSADRHRRNIQNIRGAP